MIFIKKNYLILVLLFSELSICAAQGIILLNGTYSSGKTSVGRILEAQLENAIFINEELIRKNVCNIILKKHQYPILKTDEEAYIFLNTFNKKTSPYRQSLQNNFSKHFNSLKNIERSTLIAKAIASGLTPIIDQTLTNDKEIKERLKIITQSTSVPIFHVILHCPLDFLLSHITKRNQSGNPIEKRSIKEPFYQYGKMYNSISPNLQTCDTLSRPLALEVTSKIKKIYPDFPQTSFLKHFKLDQFKSTTITPFCKCDLIVNSGISNPEECAEQIIAKFNHKFKEK